MAKNEQYVKKRLPKLPNRKTDSRLLASTNQLEIEYIEMVHFRSFVDWIRSSHWIWNIGYAHGNEKFVRKWWKCEWNLCSAENFDTQSLVKTKPRETEKKRKLTRILCTKRKRYFHIYEVRRSGVHSISEDTQIADNCQLIYWIHKIDLQCRAQLEVS